MSTNGSPRRIVVLNAGTSEAATTRMAGERLAQRTIDRLREEGVAATVSVIDLGPLMPAIGRHLVSGLGQDELQPIFTKLAEADAVIAATPVYKAGMSGLFKSFIDLLDNDLLIAKPVALVATAGTARHSLVVDESMRSLFAYLRAMTTPTSLFVAPEDWADGGLMDRMKRVAGELAALVTSGVEKAIRGSGWKQYQHSYGSNAKADGEATGFAVDFDTDLMRLATGGSLPPR